MIKTRVEELLAITDKATGGPLKVGFDGPSRPIITGKFDLLSISKFDKDGWRSYENEENDCEFFVLARTELPDLIKAYMKLATVARRYHDSQECPFCYDNGFCALGDLITKYGEDE